MQTSLSIPVTKNVNISRKLLFNQLSQIANSGLRIEDEEGIHFFGDNQAVLQAEMIINDSSCYSSFLFGGSIGAAESYIQGCWDTSNLSDVIQVFARNLQLTNRMDNVWSILSKPFNLMFHWLNRNTRRNSRKNIAAHYDISNELYQLMLDPLMQYSSAIYQSEKQSLEQAQINKLNIICQALELTEAEHLLEIGSGWGGLACFAAKNYGCQVTTITLSKEQYEYAQNKIQAEGLEQQVDIIIRDYRDMKGQYSKIVSIEMIEAVGHQYYPGYFKQIDHLLKPGGKALIQSITIAEQNLKQYRRNVDFIQKYIFPGGCLPSVTELCQQMTENSQLTVSSIHDYGEHYAKTIEDWQQRFNNHHAEMSYLGFDEQFTRMWNFYLSYCEGGFREKSIGLIHLLAQKKQYS